MKTRIYLVLTVLVLLPVCSWATDITFTSSGIIEDGDVYESVYVQNNGTVVGMSGGQIDHGLMMYDASVFNMSDGQITGSIGISYLSCFAISGGTTNSGFVVHDGGVCNISGGNINGGLKTYPAGAFGAASIVNITGGNLNFSMFDIHGVVNISRGSLYVDAAMIGGWGDQPVINIYGNNFNYNAQTKILTGYLLDNNSFIIKGIDASEYTRFNLIPEPISVLLFGFGLLSLRRIKK